MENLNPRELLLLLKRGAFLLDSISDNNDRRWINKIPRHARLLSAKNLLIVISLAVSLVVLYYLSIYNYLLFHSTIEIFTTVIAIVIFTIAWNSRHIIDNNYLAFVGIAFLFIGGLGLLHTLSYQGMGVFPEVGANFATQLWIAMRYFFSFSILIPLFFIRKKINPIAVMACYFIATLLIILSISYWNNFPVAYVEGIGLTAFKIGSEYAIAIILAISIVLLIKNRKQFSGNVFKLLIGAIAAAIATELAFTLYTDVYGVTNMVGHLLDFLSFYLIYKALVETGFSKPYDLLFRNLKQSENNLRQSNERLETIQKKLEEKADEVEKYAENLEYLAEERAKQLKDSERLAAIGATAGMVGHDIRNPLQSISGDLYFAKNDLAKIPECHEKTCIQTSLEEIEKSVEYINKIVQDLQDFARPIKLIIQEFNVEELCKEIIHNIQIPTNIRFSCVVANDAKTISTDPSIVKRILINLVNNAIQAMPDGGALSIDSSQKGNNVILSVSDTGMGIPEDIKPKLFTPLVTTKSKGQGFGLPVVKRMTEALGGSVTFESEVGKGTTFNLTLPQRRNS